MHAWGIAIMTLIAAIIDVTYGSDFTLQLIERFKRSEPNYYFF